MSVGSGRRSKRVHREIKIIDGVAHILLTGGHVAIIDVEDLDAVDVGAWQVMPGGSGLFYASRKVRTNGVRKTIRMHHIIMPLRPNCVVDHINGNGLDNRRVNLRLVSIGENARNLIIHRNGRCVGVTRDSRSGAYIARITLGYFDTESEAASAVLKAKIALETNKGPPTIP